MTLIKPTIDCILVHTKKRIRSFGNKICRKICEPMYAITKKGHEGENLTKSYRKKRQSTISFFSRTNYSMAGTRDVVRKDGIRRTVLIIENQWENGLKGKTVIYGWMLRKNLLR